MLGRRASEFMSQVNRRTSEDAARRLVIKPEHCVVELGPGSGWGLRAIAESQPKRLVGVEISPRFRRELAILDLEVPLEIYGQDAKDMRTFLGDGSVDRLLAINVVYFLDPLRAYADEFFRVMAPGARGLFAGKFNFIQENHDAVFVNKDCEAITDVLSEAGFDFRTEEVSVGEEIENYTAIEFSKGA